MFAITWAMLAEAEPRLAALLDASRRIVGSGHEPNADRVYGEAKAYAECLVGWCRGMAFPPPRPRHPGEVPLGPWFRPLMSLPAPERDYEWLHSTQAYTVACVHLHDEIIAVRDLRAA